MLDAQDDIISMSARFGAVGWISMLGTASWMCSDGQEYTYCLLVRRSTVSHDNAPTSVLTKGTVRDGHPMKIPQSIYTVVQHLTPARLRRICFA